MSCLAVLIVIQKHGCDSLVHRSVDPRSMVDVGGWTPYGGKSAFVAFFSRACRARACFPTHSLASFWRCAVSISDARDASACGQGRSCNPLSVSARLAVQRLVCRLADWRSHIILRPFRSSHYGPSARLPGLIADFHENAGTIILYLAGLHALMAIWHQFVLRDGTLKRMSLH